MSNELRVERIFEPRLVINGETLYVALIGAGNDNYRTIPAPSLSQTAIVWTTIDPPNGASSIIGRKICNCSCSNELHNSCWNKF